MAFDHAAEPFKPGARRQASYRDNAVRGAGRQREEFDVVPKNAQPQGLEATARAQPRRYRARSTVRRGKLEPDMFAGGTADTGRDLLLRRTHRHRPPADALDDTSDAVGAEILGSVGIPHADLDTAIDLAIDEQPVAARLLRT